MIARDPEKNNDFDYDFDPQDVTTQDRCPFAAHTRKAYPRNDLEGPPFNLNIDNRRILRRGIQFGPEVTPAEHASGRTSHGRGLLFAAYQSNIGNGFQFIQHSEPPITHHTLGLSIDEGGTADNVSGWADTDTFPPGKGVKAGLDPIIGQAIPIPGETPEETRSMIGTNPESQSTSLRLPTWVVPKGGEYFFSPSLPALRSTFALKA